MQRSVAGVLVALIVGWSGAVSAEEITLTTYFPSPRGVYDGLQTNTIYVRGGDRDVDQDGDVFASDALMALRCAVGQINPPSPQQCAMADLDGDGRVQMMEVQAILYQAVGSPLPGDTTPPPPGAVTTVDEARALLKQITSNAIVTDLYGHVAVGGFPPAPDALFHVQGPATDPTGLCPGPACCPSGYAWIDGTAVDRPDGAADPGECHATGLVVIGPPQPWAVGIGTMTPASTLDVNGSLYTEGGSGDVDDNGLVNAADVNAINNYLISGTALGPDSFTIRRRYAQADVDGDGRVTYEDAAIIQNMLPPASQAKDVAIRVIHARAGVRDAFINNEFFVINRLRVGPAIGAAPPLGSGVTSQMTVQNSSFGGSTGAGALLLFGSALSQWDLIATGLFPVGVAPNSVPGSSFAIRSGGARVPRVFINSAGNVGIGTTAPLAKLHVNGSIRTATATYPDYVFEPDYALESIEEHAAYMWEYRHLKALGGVMTPEGDHASFDVGQMSSGVLEELEKAHIYISQLNERVKALETQLIELRSNSQD